MNTRSTTQAERENRVARRHFTLAEANRALPYITRVVRDIRATYSQAVAVQQQLDQPLPGDDIDALRGEYERIIETLNGFVDELNDVGVELKDYEIGLVDFLTEHEGRDVCLCWRHGEETIESWHELDAGYAGRRDVAELMIDTTVKAKAKSRLK